MITKHGRHSLGGCSKKEETDETQSSKTNLVEQLVNSLEMKVHNMTTIATRNQVILKKGIDLQLNMIPFVPMNSGHDTIVERNEETKGNI